VISKAIFPTAEQELSAAADAVCTACYRQVSCFWVVIFCV